MIPAETAPAFQLLMTGTRVEASGDTTTTAIPHI